METAQRFTGIAGKELYTRVQNGKSDEDVEKHAADCNAFFKMMEDQGAWYSDPYVIRIERPAQD